ncbi:MAG: hypothetical protein GC180_01285 [Bacteroidetes bacterium]|nr:hypothetical protein [Bacteroidota bacterium]
MSHEFILNTNKVNSEKHSFDYEEFTDENGEHPKEKKAKYTYADGKGTWELISENGKYPSETSSSSFAKTKKNAFAADHAKLDEATLKVVEDSKELFHYTFMLAKKAVEKERRYLEKCTFHVKIDPSTMRLMSIEEVGNEPFKIAIIKTNNYSNLTTFIWEPRFNEYLMQEEKLSMNIHMFGQDVPFTERMTYSYD